MSNSRFIVAALVLQLAILSAANSRAQIVVDGTAEAGYGASLSVQDTTTQFGDNNSDDLIDTEAGGSEINQVFATVANDGTEDRLYVTIAGNLENNFNKLEVYIDSVAGVGQNEIVGTDLPAGVDGFCCGGFGTTDGALQRQDFLIFDAGFDADYYLTFSNGGENIGGKTFWAVSAHYAELNNGTAGRNVAAGIQLAPQGLPNVLRAPNSSDFQEDFDVDGSDLLVWQQGFGTGTNKSEGDADFSGTVDGTDLGIWQDEYGTERSLDNDFFNPTGPGVSSADLIVQPGLPGLSQGQLIDQNYALGPDGGCTADDTDGGAGCAFPELEFVLPVDSNDPDNTLNHRDFNNEVDLELALDNSNIAGIVGGDGTQTEEIGDPENVVTGIEFSIPLDEIGLTSTGFVGDIKITAFVNGTGHDFISNQFSGDGINSANVGSFTPDLETEFAGEQFVTVSVGTPAVSAVPEPTSAVLLTLSALAVLARRQS